MNNSRILTIKNAKFSGYYLYMNLNIWRNFQICINVPLRIDLDDWFHCNGMGYSLIHLKTTCFKINLRSHVNCFNEETKVLNLPSKYLILFNISYEAVHVKPAMFSASRSLTKTSTSLYQKFLKIILASCSSLWENHVIGVNGRIETFSIISLQ